MTPIQGVVQKALNDLGFESKEPEGGITGGPSELLVTEETIKKIQSLVGSVVKVDSSGGIVDNG